jgi:diguanylate cyclase (GGDEF)-like protein
MTSLIKTSPVHPDFSSTRLTNTRRPLAGIVSLLLGFLSLIHGPKAHLNQTARLPHSDEPTGLPNRRALTQQLQLQLSGKRPSPQGRSGAPLPHGGAGRGVHQASREHIWSLLLISLDQFRAIHDQHGQQAGDELLRAVAACLRRDLRQSDLLGRWDGEEFLVLLQGASFEGAMVAAERLRQCVAGQMLIPAASLTLSIGVASYRLGDSLERMLARADAGLYSAKLAGRNRVSFKE